MDRDSQNHALHQAETRLRAEWFAWKMANKRGSLGMCSHPFTLVSRIVVGGLICALLLVSAGCGVPQRAQEEYSVVVAPKWSPEIPSIDEIEAEFLQPLDGGRLSEPLRLVTLTIHVDDENDLREVLALAPAEALVAIDGPEGLKAELLYSPGKSLAEGMLSDGQVEYDGYVAAFGQLAQLGATQDQCIASCRGCLMAIGWRDDSAIGIALEAPPTGYTGPLPEFGVPLQGRALLDALNSQLE